MHIDCPRAKSDMTPCVLRDGELAADDRGCCVGCGERIGEPSPSHAGGGDAGERLEDAVYDVLNWWDHLEACNHGPIAGHLFDTLRAALETMTAPSKEVMDAIERGEHELQPCLRDSKRLIYPANCDECVRANKCLARMPGGGDAYVEVGVSEPSAVVPGDPDQIDTYGAPLTGDETGLEQSQCSELSTSAAPPNAVAPERGIDRGSSQTGGGDAPVDMSMEAVKARLATYQPLGSHAKGVAGPAIAPDELSERDGADPTQTGGGDAGERPEIPKEVWRRSCLRQAVVIAELRAALRSSHRESAEAMREAVAVAFANLPAISNAIRALPIPQ